MLGRDNSRYKGFDGLRGISIILVIISHLGFWGNFPQYVVDRVIPVFAGMAGVNVFFVISGFLITALLLKERDNFGSVSVKLFAIRRALRLIPPFLVFIVVLGSLMLFEVIPSSGKALLLSVFYLYNFVPHGALYTNELAHTWSLAIEEHFYVVWPWFVAKLNINSLVNAVVGLVLLCLIVSMFVSGTRSRWTIPGTAPILIGCFFALYHFVLLPQRRWWCEPNDKAIGIVGLLLWALPLIVPPYFFRLIYFPQLVGFGLMVYWVFRNGESRIVRVLESVPLVYIGSISYGLYLWQGLFVTNSPGGKLWMQHFPQNIFLTFAVAILSYHFFEVRFLCIKKKFVRNTSVKYE